MPHNNKRTDISIPACMGYDRLPAIISIVSFYKINKFSPDDRRNEEIIREHAVAYILNLNKEEKLKELYANIAHLILDSELRC
ncbi:hypothetical protein [Trabulsiella odontotermitis]|uniref:hypothetical protein n=1 Tax=Trabulsiella odontotermitis TaxID=379893 RepID=UPI000AE2090B|nr:hypothetical protein [Trabulsiella odontotermitis]